MMILGAARADAGCPGCKVKIDLRRTLATHHVVPFRRPQRYGFSFSSPARWLDRLPRAQREGSSLSG
jgi:hypothetical protein